MRREEKRKSRGYKHVVWEKRTKSVEKYTSRREEWKKLRKDGTHAKTRYSGESICTLIIENYHVHNIVVLYIYTHKIFWKFIGVVKTTTIIIMSLRFRS